MMNGLTAHLTAKIVMSVQNAVSCVWNAAGVQTAQAGKSAERTAVKTVPFAWIVLWIRGIIVPIATNVIWTIEHGAMNAADAVTVSKTATIAVFWARASFVSSAHQTKVHIVLTAEGAMDLFYGVRYVCCVKTALPSAWVAAKKRANIFAQTVPSMTVCTVPTVPSVMMKATGNTAVSAVSVPTVWNTVMPLSCA